MPGGTFQQFYPLEMSLILLVLLEDALYFFPRKEAFRNVLASFNSAYSLGRKCGFLDGEGEWCCFFHISCLFL